MRDPKSILLEFLNSQSTMTLATLCADGLPLATPVYYVVDENLTLYWLSAPNTRHAANLARNNRITTAVYPEVWDWRVIKGAQMEGVAYAVSDPIERERALSLYRAKFRLPAAFDLLILGAELYGMRPSHARRLDNSIRFGYKEELDLA